MSDYTWPQRLRIAVLFGAVLVLSLAWFAAPGLLVGGVISDWHLQDWTPRSAIAVGAAILINFMWARLTGRWLRDRMDKPLDRAVDWAMR